MWSNLLTNQKQGRLFHEVRASIMNFPVDYKDDQVQTRKSVVQVDLSWKEGKEIYQ